MTNSQFQLESKDINVWFGERQVLKDVSLQFPSNKVTALIGPSGCGKSTFIRTLNRMHELIPGAGLAGSVMLDGNDIYDESVDPTTVRLRVGMVFQKPNPFPTMSIKENVISGLRLSGRKSEISDDLVENSLKRASMWSESKDRLDEPCSALDPGSTRRIEETILELKESMTIVIVTHNMQQAQRVADKTAFFLADDNQPGHVVEFGETEQVFGMPVDPRTNDYVNGHFG